MLRDVKHNISDGLLGFPKPTGDGLHIKIGVSPVVSDTPITILGSMDAATIKERLGLSPLADSTMDSVLAGASRIFCLPVSATTAGTVGEVTHNGDGGGSMTVTGSPHNAFSVIFRITAQGGLNTAAFVVCIAGGYSFTDEITVPMTGDYEIAGTGLKVKFAEATEPEQQPSSFLVNDTFTFSTTAPTMTNGDVLAAIEKVKRFNQEFEMIHIVGASTPSLWIAVSEAQKELMEVSHKPAFMLLEAAMPDDEEDDLTDWALQMESDRQKIKNTDVQVCAAWGRLVRLDGTTQVVNLAGLAAGRYAMTKVSVSIGKTRSEDGLGFQKSRLLELLPSGYDDSIIELLDVAGYLTFREYDGLDDFFVYHTKMMCPDGSDFRYAEDVRVRNKIIRETRKEALQVMNDDIDLEDIQGELEARAKFISTPLDRMVKEQEISSYETTVLEGHEETFLEDETMRIKIRYLSRGYIREVEVDLGRAPISE